MSQYCLHRCPPTWLDYLPPQDTHYLLDKWAPHQALPHRSLLEQQSLLPLTEQRWMLTVLRTFLCKLKLSSLQEEGQGREKVIT